MQTSNTKNIIIGILAILLIAVVILFVNSLRVPTSDGSYVDHVMSVEEIESSQPTTFLSADGTYRENFLGDKFKVTCTIKNKATVTTYKDVVLRVTYYTKTKTELGSDDYTIYELFPPNSEKTVQLKIDNYKHTESVGWEVINASAN